MRTARNARRGRLTDNEVDLVRAAIVFAGAGLDATLKQLIRDALPSVIEDNEQARKKFEIFAADAVAGVEAADPKRVARYLVALHPRTQLIDDYIRSITGDSLQSVEQVQLVAGALGSMMRPPATHQLAPSVPSRLATRCLTSWTSNVPRSRVIATGAHGQRPTRSRRLTNSSRSPS